MMVYFLSRFFKETDLFIIKLQPPIQNDGVDPYDVDDAVALLRIGPGAYGPARWLPHERKHEIEFICVMDPEFLTPVVQKGNSRLMDIAPPDSRLVPRHRLVTRLWHWLNAALLYILFTSGLGIFNAHPRLYWGHYGANFDAPWLKLERFGGWLTLPAHYNLALSRHWHLTAAPIFAFALLFYMVWSLLSRHIAHDLRFARGELAPRRIWRDICDHARLRFPTGDAALRYNVLQKASYIGVIFVALPLLIFTGLAMSPGMNAAWPWLVDLFGGRQSARSIHFIAAFGLAAFFLVHMAMVLLAGPRNEVRSMITGRYRLPQARP